MVWTVFNIYYDQMGGRFKNREASSQPCIDGFPLMQLKDLKALQILGSNTKRVDRLKHQGGHQLWLKLFFLYIYKYGIY